MTKKKEITPKKNISISNTKTIKIKIIGIGGGGGNIIKELAKKLDFSSNKIDFVAVNTDTQALDALPKDLKKISIGDHLTGGLGTGRDFDLGERIANEEEDKIKKIFSDNKDLYILVSSLGGGTGTGCTPVFARIAKELDLTSFGIFTLPFSFEGKEKIKEAEKVIDRTKQDLNAALVLPNERIFKIVSEDVPFNKALDTVNEQLASSLEGLLSTIYSSGLINIDWADIKTTIEGGKKKAYLNTERTKLNGDLEEFVNKLLGNLLIDYDFSSSTNVLFNIEGGKDMSMKELTKISERIHELAPNAKIIFGLSQNAKLKSEVRATILATGIQVEKDKKAAKKKKTPKAPKIKKEEIKEEVISEPILNIEQELKELEEMGVQVNRKSALDIQVEKQEEIKREEEEEDMFDIPAFLRKKK